MKVITTKTPNTNTREIEARNKSMRGCTVWNEKRSMYLLPKFCSSWEGGTKATNVEKSDQKGAGDHTQQV
ncbi:hypothetical protein HPP92_019412 [Vanilla planifolia]|uniref:Uncharacterized protein n=1 Tax=Vanilla planifolia TaxID=51239 RepID=A0A835UKX4_VANPL|nr:hypothetical protein HPP92_019412 [Vanilla planifolia]